MLFTLQRIL